MKTMTLLELECVLGRKFPYSDLVKGHSSVGGGAVRDWIAGIEASDVDLFHVSGKVSSLEKFTNPDFGGKKIHHVYIDHNNTNELLHTFDFTIDQYAVSLQNDMDGMSFPNGVLVVTLGDTTLSDIKNKELKYCYNKGGTHPVFHVKRIGKFTERGYSIDIEEVISMCERVVEEKDSPQLDYDDGEIGR